MTKQPDDQYASQNDQPPSPTPATPQPRWTRAAVVHWVFVGTISLIVGIGTLSAALPAAFSFGRTRPVHIAEPLHASAMAFCGLVVLLHLLLSFSDWLGPDHPLPEPAERSPGVAVLPLRRTTAFGDFCKYGFIFSAVSAVAYVPIAIMLESASRGIAASKTTTPVSWFLIGLGVICTVALAIVGLDSRGRSEIVINRRAGELLLPPLWLRKRARPVRLDSVRAVWVKREAMKYGEVRTLMLKFHVSDAIGMRSVVIATQDRCDIDHTRRWLERELAGQLEPADQQA